MKFLESDNTELVFIDSDMGWKAEALYNLIRAEEEFIGAVYPCKNMWQFYGCHMLLDKNEKPVMNEKGYYGAWNVPTGLCKIKKSVFEKMMSEFPENYYYTEKGGKKEKQYNFFGKLAVNEVREFQNKFWGEDTSFCLKWKSIGGEMWVMPDCDVTHLGVQEVKGNFKEHIESGHAVKEFTSIGI